MYSYKQSPEHAIRLLGPRTIFGDLYRVFFFAGVYFILFCVYWFVGGRVGMAAMSSVAGTMASLWLGMPSRMPISSHRDRAIAETYLSSKSYRRNGNEWTPALARPLYFDSQKVQVHDNEVRGPVITLRRLRGLFDAA